MASEDISRIESLLREHFAQTEKQLSDMRADNAEFRVQMMKDFNAFAEKIDDRINKFEEKIDAKFEKIDSKFDTLTTAVVELQRDVEGLKHDVAGLYHWDYWLLSIILVVFAMPQIVAGIKALFGAFAEGISLVMRAFRKEGKA
ncbi:MAG: hypothetical protein II876_07540 [Synergistaceae bacterium]|nr:hypothetical protein [Synergistaceae bacterium]